jgi:hypothetical protein
LCDQSACIDESPGYSKDYDQNHRADQTIGAPCA